VNIEKIMEWLSRFAFASASLVLMAMSIALVLYGAAEVAMVGTGSWRDAGGVLLSAIGYVVIAMAVFDVAKYFIEEEVIRSRELREAAEARKSLTKFVSTIAIAVFIEGLVIVFQASKDDLPTMVYPTALLLTATLIVVGLGVFQRLSAEVEDKIDKRKSR
jgi:archaellum biogenesis protein FlaJ (TadC family)